MVQPRPFPATPSKLPVEPSTCSTASACSTAGSSPSEAVVRASGLLAFQLDISSRSSGSNGSICASASLHGARSSSCATGSLPAASECAKTTLLFGCGSFKFFEASSRHLSASGRRPPAPRIPRPLSTPSSTGMTDFVSKTFILLGIRTPISPSKGQLAASAPLVLFMLSVSSPKDEPKRSLLSFPCFLLIVSPLSDLSNTISRSRADFWH